MDLEPLLEGTEDSGSGALVVLSRPAGAGGGRSAPGAEGDAERVLEALEEEVLRRFAARRCRLQFRPGALPGETAVAAVVRAAHRREAFEAARWVVAEVRERLSGPARPGADDGPAEGGPGEADDGAEGASPDGRGP